MNTPHATAHADNPRASAQPAAEPPDSDLRSLVEARDRHLEELFEERIAERTRALAATAESAQRASRAKSAMLANISHEIRAPLNAIVGFSDSLADPRIPDSVRNEAIAIVRRNARQLMEVINDALDFSRIEFGRLEVERVPCALGPLLAETVAHMTPRIEGKGLRLDADYEGLVPATIRTDPVRLRQVLLVLLGNALDCTERGSVSLRVSQLEAGMNPQSPEDASILIRVSDTGRGLSGEQLAQLFEPYSQVDAQLAGTTCGTGMSFAIARELARALGGDIGARSSAGGGTVFELVVAAGSTEGVELEDGLPTVMETGRPDEEPPGGAAQWLTGMRILVAEDQPESQILMTYLLGEPGAGAEVDIAANGQHAVDQALAAVREGRPYDVVLMDMQMPVLDGYDATSRLRSYGYDRPIIALTAHALPSDRARCLDAGCDEYLSKPVDRRRLLQTLTEYGRGPVAVKWRASARGEGAAADPGVSPVNASALLERCMGDRALAARLLSSLAARGGEDMGLIAQAIAQPDPDAARTLLHAFKGGCAYLYATALAEASAGLEAAVVTSNPELAQQELARLRREWDRFRDFADAFSSAPAS